MHFFAAVVSIEKCSIVCYFIENTRKDRLCTETMKILIADSLDEFRSALAEILGGSNQVRTAEDGLQTLQLLASFSPDVLVLDMMMPGLDGISLLQRAAQQGIHPTVLATTRFFSDYIRYACEQLSVAYLMVKPCDIHAAVARILDLSKQTTPAAAPRPDPRNRISEILLQMGISAKLRGYDYLREAILLMLKDPAQSLTKELYPSVADLCGAAPIQIERSIRSAIQTAWVKRDDGLWQRYLQSAGCGSVPRPTNATFIRRLADHLRLSGETYPEE